MKISQKKTKVLVCSRKEHKHRTTINIGEKNVEKYKSSGIYAQEKQAINQIKKLPC